MYIVEATRSTLLTIGGQTHTIGEWSRMSGISVSALITRCDRGWPVEELLEPGRRSCRGRQEKVLSGLTAGLETGDWTDRLRMEIVRQAISDHRSPLYRLEVERFFRSRWFGTLFDLDGEQVLDGVTAMEGQHG